MMKYLMTVGIITVLLFGCSKENEKDVITEDSTEEVETMVNEIVGIWKGTIETPQSPLPIELNLEEASGSLSVPVQGITNYPFESIEYKDNTVDISINLQGQLITINGTLAEDKLKGTFTQNGASFPLTLQKGEQNNHTDTDIPVTYENITIPVAGGELKAALQRAQNEELSPVAIIIAGSGPTDKDGNSPMLKSDSYKMLAEQLAAQNISTIRYDKRGVGDNIQLVDSPESLVIEVFVNDVERIIQYAKEDTSFTSIHIIGHSEGALIGTLASGKEQVDSVILLAGTGRTVDEVLLEQLSASLPPLLLTESEKILEQIKDGKIVKSMSPELQSVFAVQSQPYLTSWIHYHPAEELKKINVPSLIIHGTTDIQVNKKDAEQLAAVADHIQYIEGMNHILKDAPENREENIATYNNPALPLNKELVPIIVEFLTEK